MKLYRTRPATVEAVEWTGDNAQEVFDFGGYPSPLFVGIFYVRLPTGELRRYRASEFHAQFEPVV